MEHPVRDIPHVIHALTEGSPLEQKTALETYVLPNASFEHPFCRVPSFSEVSIPLIGIINSRWVLWMVYRWYKILSPRIILDVHSVVFDQKQQILYASISQVFSLFFVPFYAPKVNLVTVLHLLRDADDNKYYIQSQTDLYQLNEFVKFVWPGGATLLVFWQWMNTLLSILGAVVLAPLTWAEEELADRRKIQ